MPTSTQNSLKHRSERMNPVQKLARGNWAPSDFDAWYGDLAGEAFALGVFDISMSTIIRTMVFGNDYPILCQLRTYYGVSTTPYISVATNYLEEPSYVYGDLAGNMLITPDDAVTTPGQAASGTTATNAVRVEGYIIRSTLKDRNLVNVAADVDPNGKLLVRFEHNVLEGPQDFIRTAWETFPIILHEPNYTQAMFNNDNLLTIGAVTYKIVGIWNQYNPQV